jgi:hypothetical protein
MHRKAYLLGTAGGEFGVESEAGNLRKCRAEIATQEKNTSQLSRRVKEGLRNSRKGPKQGFGETMTHLITSDQLPAI